MINAIGPVSPLTLTAPAAVIAGQGLLIVGVFGVVGNAQASGEKLSLHTQGVFSLPKLTSENFVVGTKVYWDDTNKWLTSTVGSNKLVGYCCEITAASAATCKACLTGQA